WFFPINKKLWTSSYALFTGGLALSLLALCYLVIDVRGRSRWSFPFVVYGMNAIGIYVLSGVLASLLYSIRVSTPSGTTSLYEGIYRTVFAWIGPAAFSSLLFALTWVV